MASATITVKDKADNNVVFSLVGSTANGATYKVATRELSVPKTLEFEFRIGAPGSLGNDKVIVTLKDSVLNSDTGLVKTAQLKLEVSIPRDAAITSNVVEDLICHLQALTVDTVAETLADAMVP